MASTEDGRRLYAQHKSKVAVSTGIMNLFGAMIGSVPMCHGAGGMAGHIAFGARTGGSLGILGGILVTIALFFSGSVQTLLQIFPSPILGVIVFLTGAQLALGSCDLGETKADCFVCLVTAACAIWNIGVAFIVGIAIYHLLRRGWVRL